MTYFTHELRASLLLIHSNGALLNVLLAPFFELFTTVHFPQVIWFHFSVSVPFVSVSPCFFLSAGRFRPARAVFPFRRAPSARRFRPARAIFPLRLALFARRSRLSVRFPVASCVTRSASLPLRPVSRSAPFSRFLRTVLSCFRRVLLYSTNIFALWRFARQTVTLGFGITHLFCSVACVCTLF